MTEQVVEQAELDLGGGPAPFGERELRDFRQEAAVDLISRHERTLRRTARRYSICVDDAEDAYQRALEILLTKAPPITGESLIRWMQTVTKREALGVRRQRARLVGTAPPGSDDSEVYDPFEAIAFEGPQPDERVERVERVRRSSEALRALKPQEVRALILKAEGYSYSEIQEITGWTYTKVNRCMAEGRKRFLDVFADIEKGERCQRWEDCLSQIADGETEGEDLIEARVHLRTCAFCRSRLREYRRVPGRVFGLGLPMPLLGAIDWFDSTPVVVADHLRNLSATVTKSIDSIGERVMTLASAGGTRGSGTVVLGKLLAVCGMAAAGSAACAVTGVMPEPVSSAAQVRDVETPPSVALPLPTSDDEATDEVPGTDGSGETDVPPVTPEENSADQFSFESSQPSAEPKPPPPTSGSARAQSANQPQFGFEQ
jgi:RNA polymerase sigma factor (sigma-70 family)